MFPDRVNGKTPDQMTPDEFEQYLGLRGPSPDDMSPFALEPRKGTTAIDKMLAGELAGGLEDSYAQH